MTDCWKYNEKDATSSLSSLALWPFGSFRNSSVSRRHSPTFSGETKSTATFVHDCTSREKISCTYILILFHYIFLILWTLSGGFKGVFKLRMTSSLQVNNLFIPKYNIINFFEISLRDFQNQNDIDSFNFSQANDEYCEV